LVLLGLHLGLSVLLASVEVLTLADHALVGSVGCQVGCLLGGICSDLVTLLQVEVKILVATAWQLITLSLIMSYILILVR
jgi:hypothetical protein